MGSDLWYKVLTQNCDSVKFTFISAIKAIGLQYIQHYNDNKKIKKERNLSQIVC